MIAPGLVELLFLSLGKFHWHQFLSVLVHPAQGALHVFPGEEKQNQKTHEGLPLNAAGRMLPVLHRLPLRARLCSPRPPAAEPRTPGMLRRPRRFPACPRGGGPAARSSPHRLQVPGVCVVLPRGGRRGRPGAQRRLDWRRQFLSDRDEGEPAGSGSAISSGLSALR